jgi:DNA-binding transcriptional LysR family regulator
MIDIRQLRYFLSVVQLGGVGAAAAAHLVTQPAVSAQIRRLEEEVGEKLFAREGRRMVPTETGRALARQARDVVRRMERFEADVRALRGLEAGHLRMGSIDAASVYVLPALYQEFHDHHPGIAIEITVGDSRELLRALRDGDVELATTTLPVADEALEVREIYREQLVPVTHPADPLSRRRRVTVAELAEHGIIAYPEGATTRGLIDDVFRAHGATARARMEISSPEAIRRLSQAGLGATILPRPVVAAEIEQGALVELRIPGVRFERAIGMVHRGRDALSPAARAFLDMVLSRVDG